MKDDQFWADVQVERNEDGLWVAVLVLSKEGGSEDASEPEELRVPLQGAYADPDQAREAAMAAIDAMAIEGPSQ